MCVGGIEYAIRCDMFGFRLQVSMLGKGVVEAMVKVLAATQGGGAEALQVQQTACAILQNVAIAADNKVLGCAVDVDEENYMFRMLYSVATCITYP